MLSWPQYTAIVTLLAVAFYFFLATRVAAAHGKFGIRLPATTGNPDFERIFRAHVNTLEWMPSFLVPLWLLRNLLERRQRSSARTRLDCWPCLVLRRLLPRRGEAIARLLRPVDGVPLAVHRRGRGRCHAFGRQLRVDDAARRRDGRARVKIELRELRDSTVTVIKLSRPDSAIQVVAPSK